MSKFHRKRHIYEEKKQLVTSLGIVGLSATMLAGGVAIRNSLSAKSNVISQEERYTDFDLSIFDSYVSVQNNQFTLDLPHDHGFTSLEIAQAENQIQESNSMIQDGNLELDEATGAATIVIDTGLERGEGVTKVTFHWNYARVYIARSMLIKGISAAVGAVAGMLAAKFGVPFLSDVVTKIVSGFFGILIGELITSGIWFDLNYFYVLSKSGLQ